MLVKGYYGSRKVEGGGAVPTRPTCLLRAQPAGFALPRQEDAGTGLRSGRPRPAHSAPKRIYAATAALLFHTEYFRDFLELRN